MSKPLKESNTSRYSSPVIVDHLASNYVTGLLTQRVRQRVDGLRTQFRYRHIDRRINYWEQKLAPLNDKVPELAPMPDTWQNIQTRLNMGQQQAEQPSGFLHWLSFPISKWAGAFVFAICAFFGASLLRPADPLGSLSYVAVLEDNSQTPQVVAATYRESKKLVLDILTLPDINSDESFELWVTSKTDNQTRSLGEIPKGETNFNRQLSDAEWRLIADSSFLIISVEDMGGSALGEPSDRVVSKGLCIRLPQEDKTQA